MPFDGGTYTNTTIIAARLTMGRGNIEKHWRNCYSYHYTDGTTVCAQTALYNYNDYDNFDANGALACDHLVKTLGVTSDLELFRWNDRWWRRKKDVLKLYDRALASLP